MIYSIATALILLLVNVKSQESSMQPKILKSLAALEAYRTSSHNQTYFERVQNVDVIQNSDLEDMEGKAICHMIEMNRHSIQAGPTKITFPSTYPLECIAAVALAMEHLNTGDGSVVKEVDGLNQRCPIRFTSEFFDTVGSPSIAVDQVINAVQRTPEEQLPCAFIGAFRAQTNIATGLYTGLKGYPQVATLTSAPELDNKDTYPLYGSLNPTNSALPFLKFLVEKLKINHLGVIYTDNASGLNWINPLREAAAEYYPDFQIEGVSYTLGVSNYEATIKALKATGFRYFYAVVGTEEYPEVVAEATRQGISGTGKHTWISWVGVAVTFLLNREFEPDDPMFLHGKGMIIYDTTLRSIPGIGRYDQFLEKRSELANPGDIEYLQSKIPQHPDPTYSPQFTNESFGLGRFTGTSATVYDATIALGLSACNAAAESPGLNNFDGPSHYGKFKNITFEGASGSVAFDPVTGSRTAISNLYVVTNIVPQDVEGSSNMTLGEVRAEIFDREWRTEAPITFADGSQSPLPDLPEQNVDTNVVSTALRAIGLTMGGIILLSSLGCAVWTEMKKKQRIVMASQPIFLQFICLGTFMMGSAIIPLSLDDEVVSDDGADIACKSIPWLISLGWCVAFAALFSKTKRINTIFHNVGFRRVKVDAKDVIKPMVGLLLLNIIVLTIWTILSPMLYVREVTSYDPFMRPSESSGQCQSEQFWAFAAPLIVIDLGALLYAMQQAYVARKISTEFAESEWIARAMSFILLVSFVTIPVLIITEYDTAASYFVECALVFVVSLSLLGFIFLPKMLYRGKMNQKSIVSTMNNMGSTQMKDAADRYSGAFTTTTSETEGALILEHPKMNEKLRGELKSLKHAKKELEKEMALLKGEELKSANDTGSSNGDMSQSDKTTSAYKADFTGNVLPMGSQDDSV